MEKSDTQKKNILFMAQLPPPIHGAALRNKSLLESELINSNFKIYSLPLKFINDMKDLGKFSFMKIFLMLRHCILMTGILLTKKIDLVYFTMSPSGGSFYRDILFLAIIKRFRKKRILHFRVKGIKKTSHSRVGKWFVKYAFRGSEIVCLSNHHMLDMNGLTSNKPYIVPNGIKIETKYLISSVQVQPIPDPQINILFLSNLSRKKGIPELIEALRILKEKGYDFSANLVGSEWDMTFNEVNELIRGSALEGMVIAKGPKYGSDKFNFIKRADIFAFPTYFELFPGVILEAMQFGKAIVSTFEGSIPEMIDNNINGVLVEQRNVVQLAEGIAFLIDNPLKRQEMAIQAKKKFFEQFTLAAFEQKMNDVFWDVIQKSGPDKPYKNGS